jgi:ABC-type iron transport system FetAB permease component
VLRLRLVTVLLVSVLSRLRFVNGIVRVVVCYFVIHYCLAVYSQYYFILVFSFIGIATVVSDPCPDYIKNSDIGKYISSQPILSLKVFMSF